MSDNCRYCVYFTKDFEAYETEAASFSKTLDAESKFQVFNDGAEGSELSR